MLLALRHTHGTPTMRSMEGEVSLVAELGSANARRGRWGCSRGRVRNRSLVQLHLSGDSVRVVYRGMQYGFNSFSNERVLN